MRSVRIGTVADFGEGRGTAVELDDGTVVAVFNVGGRLACLNDTCPHREGPLSEGELKATTVVCPWHFTEFDLATGRALNRADCGDVAVFPVTVESDGSVFISV